MTDKKRGCTFGWFIALTGCMALMSAPLAQVPVSTDAIKSAPLLLDVVVTDKSGKAIPGLSETDFTVLDNKQPMKMISFRPHSTAGMAPDQVDASTEIILVLDEVNAPYDRVAYAREGIENFLKQHDGNLIHPVSLAFFSDGGLQVQEKPAVDGNALAAVLAKHPQSLRTIERGEGFYGAEERLKKSIDALEQLIAREEHEPGRKMVIWVSPGWPLLSDATTNPSPNQKQHTFDTVVQLSQAMQRARMTMYSIDPLGTAGIGGVRTSYYQNFIKGLAKADNAEFADLGLQVLATQTGGRVIFGNDSIQSSINSCIADLNAFYSLTVEMLPSDTGNTFHPVQVELKAAGLKVRTNIGYYAQP